MQEAVKKKLDALEIKIEEEIEQAKTHEARMPFLANLIAQYANTLTDGTPYFTDENVVNRCILKNFRQKKARFENLQTQLVNYHEQNNLLGKIEEEEEEEEANTIYHENSGNDEFMVQSTRRVSGYIEQAVDSLDALKKQRAYLNSMREKISNGLTTLGVSDEIVNKISTRYLSDKRCFMAGVASLFGLFILIKCM